jgi:4-amino-4-deoxychorismate lyase
LSEPPDVPATWVDGLAAETVSVRDRGLQYGDGVFETITCMDGRPRWLDRHMNRLLHGCVTLGLEFHEQARLRQEVAMLALTAPCIVKVIVTRGASAGRGYRAGADLRSTRIVSRYDWPPAGPGALRVGWSAVTLGENPKLAGLKHLNRLEQVLAQNAMPAALDEVLLCSAGGAVIGASAGNLFLIGADGGLATPALDRCGVAGVVRGLVLELAARLGVPATLRRITAADVAAAAGLFVTNVRRGPQAIGWLDGREFPPHPLVARLANLIHATP